MVLPIRDAKGKLWGIQVAWLDFGDGILIKTSKEPKRQSYGILRGNFIHLTKINWEHPPDKLLIGEGAETVLSAMQLTGLLGIATGGKGFMKYLTLATTEQADGPHCSREQRSSRATKFVGALRTAPRGQGITNKGTAPRFVGARRPTGQSTASKVVRITAQARLGLRV